ncbi:hypothetical protein AB1Y20_020997 [Prymnesium parvum]|uniref:Uncharacterized protein n=1 Tax=Prymnesium parvum TaxID=97485 RepID=A0AB34JIB0_PRYPA
MRCLPHPSVLQLPQLRPTVAGVTARTAPPRLSLLGLSLVADITVDQGPEGSQPVSALLENGIAVAYLGVLAVLFGFLAYLALADQRAKKRREESMLEMQEVSEALRREGKVVEAEVLEGELKKIKEEPQKVQTKRQTAGFEDEGNRFSRRQQKERRKRRKK